MMYIRFVVGVDGEEPRIQTGVVTNLRLLRESGELSDYEEEYVAEIFEWLNENLPCPPFQGKGWSKEAISWFKHTAQEPISKFQDMIAILQEYGRPVKMLRTQQPGMILYEDAFQIVAQSRHY